MQLDLNGLIPATLTPLTDSFAVDEDGLRRYIEWLTSFDGLKGCAVNMDTGEGPHLTREEKRRIIIIWKSAVGDRLPILAGVSGPSTANAVHEARDAQEAGADGLVIFPIPAYAGQPLPLEIPLRYHEAIASAVKLPLVLFQLQQSLGGAIFANEILERLLKMENVVAIKEASFDPAVFVRTVEVVKQKAPTVSLLTGNDNFIYESFLLGADGALIGFGTILVAEQIAMLEHVKAKQYDEALLIYREKVRPLVNAIFSAPVTYYRARLKEALRMLGVLDNSIMRPPLLSPAPEENAGLRRLLKEIRLLS